MKKRIPSLDDFINESNSINEGYSVNYDAIDLKKIKFLASKYVKKPTHIIFGIPNKNIALQLNVKFYPEDSEDIKKPYAYTELDTGTGGKLWKGRPVIIVYDKEDGEYVLFQAANLKSIVIGANIFKETLSNVLKSLDSKQELKSETDYQSIVDMMKKWSQK